MDDGKVDDRHDVDEAASLAYRAEDLTRDELREWTVLTDRERTVLQKLKAPGQRLLIGPRGCGKSTYLKLTYYECLDPSSSILPIYVNYSRSISLEPELQRSSGALALFRQWILANLVAGLAKTLDDIGTSVPFEGSDFQNIQDAQRIVDAVERRRIDEIGPSALSISNTLTLLERGLDATHRQRAILLLDDAAHAFSADQQREFFEVMASLRSRRISAKAAVYPGVTTYTSRFHVGHDAQLIDVWLDVDDHGYLGMMREVARKRLPADKFSELERREGILDYLALASFGLPRSFIAMLSKFLEDTRAAPLSSSTQLADAAIRETAETAEKVFDSLEDKLPRYKNFVHFGRELLDATVGAIKQYNESGRASDSRTTLCLYERPLASEVERILGFFEYAGLIRRRRPVKMGQEQYEVVAVHYSLLLRDAALGLGRNPAVTEAVNVLEKRPPNVWTRRKVEALVGDDYLGRCRLNLLPCQVCGSAREVPEAKFCFNCGARLEEASIYDELLVTSIERLPLSAAILKRIGDHSSLKEVKDILMDEERQSLLTVPYIGAVRANRIYSVANEFVYE